jgi:hypothetical protein
MPRMPIIKNNLPSSLFSLRPLRPCSSLCADEILFSKSEGENYISAEPRCPRGTQRRRGRREEEAIF